MKKRSPYHCSSLMLLLLIFMAVSVSESQVISMDQKAGTNSRTHLFKVENELGHLAAGLNEIHNVWMNHADDLSEFFSPKLHEFRYKNVLSDQQQNMENISMECLNAVVQFSLDLKDLRPYTKRVIDASGKLPSRVGLGNFNWLGSYAECVAIHADLQNDTFNGQMCTISLNMGNTTISLGMCVNDVCSSDDLTQLVYLGLLVFPGAFKYAYATCATEAPWKAGDSVASVLCGLILAALVIGTLYDIVIHWSDSEEGSGLSLPGEPSPALLMVGSDDDEPLLQTDSPTVQSDDDNTDTELLQLSPVSHQPGLLSKLLLCFSVPTNASKLLTAQQHESSLAVVNGLRVLSMCWVILGHSYLIAMSIIDNPADILSLVRRYSFQFVLNGTFSVDTFFFLSGLLVTFITLKKLNSQHRINWPLFYFHRFWRLTPLYMVILMLWTTLALHIPTGPMMRALDNNFCYDYWWTNLLYINNFYPTTLNGECMAWSWYLANDMQFFLISPVFIYLLYKNKKGGVAVIVAVIVISLATTGLIATKEKVKLSILSGAKAKGFTMDEIYTKPYTRINVYLVGMLTGFILVHTKAQITFKKKTVFLGWLVTAILALAVLFGLYGVNRGDVNLPQRVASLYTATSRFAWSLFLAWLTLACSAGYGGPVNTFLSWEAWIPLGRLTFAAYLLHPIVMMVFLSSMKVLIHLTDLNMIWIYAGHVVISYGLAFIFSVCIESPTLALEKVILRRLTF